MKMNTSMLILATLSMGLMAGLFYAWSISVTPGLKRLDDENYLHAFQSMNRAILNPAFFIVFLGLVILLPLLCFLFYQAPLTTAFWFILAATIIYMAGIMAVTIWGNVPLNNALEVLPIESLSPEQRASFRLGFESRWNHLNMIRTISSALTLALLIVAGVQNAGK